MRVALIVAGVIAGLIVAIVIIGWMLPERHRASRSLDVDASPHDVFALIERVDEYPSWRRDVKRVEVLTARSTGGGAGPLRFREHGSNGVILYEWTDHEADRRIVSRIADAELPFGGTWTYEIAPRPGGASLRITEDGEVYNPVFRFMSRFVFGHTSSIDGYLRDVAGRLGGDARIHD